MKTYLLMIPILCAIGCGLKISPNVVGSKPVDMAVSVEEDLATQDFAGVECDVVSQYGCFPGRKCTTQNLRTTRCDIIAPQPVPRGQVCALAVEGDNCEAGSVCVDAGGGNRMCRAYCSKDSDCGPNSFCDQALGGGFLACSQPCDPLANTGCPANLSCYLSSRLVQKTDCFVPGAHPNGGYCNFHQDCAPKLTCQKGGQLGKLCTPLCNIKDPQQCANPYPKCSAIPSANGPYPDYGYCS